MSEADSSPLGRQQALAAYGAARSHAQTWPNAYMRLAAPPGSREIARIGIFPDVTDRQRALIINNSLFSGLHDLLDKHMSLVRPPGGKDYTEIDYRGIAGEVGGEKPIVPPLTAAYEVRDTLAVTGLCVILYENILQLGPEEYLFEDGAGSWLA